MRKRRGRHIEINCGAAQGDAKGARARQLHLHSAIATPIENGMPQLGTFTFPVGVSHLFVYTGLPL